MATTYTLIKGETLASSAASYTFSAIPSTWTDLCVRMSVRSDEASDVNTVIYKINSTTSNYSQTRLFSNGSSVGSVGTASSAQNYVGRSNSGTSTSNTFTNAELYIPSYASSQYKPSSSFSAYEINAATFSYLETWAELWRDNSAITSLTFSWSSTPANFVSGSSFYLYGIRSS